MGVISLEAADDAVAAISADSGEEVTFDQLEIRSRSLAHVLHECGVDRGGHLAILLDNTVRYFEVCWAARRSGVIATPINWHLGADEAGYIIEDCGATALVSTIQLAPLLNGVERHLGSVSTRL